MKIVSIRNPWDQAVSYYNWKFRIQKSKKKRANHEDKEDFFGWMKSSDYKTNNVYFFTEGRPILYDFIIRFEHLQEDFDTLCDQLGLPQTKLPRLKGYVRRDPAHYSEYYTDEMIEYIANRFKLHIDRFNYEFEDRRNHEKA
jgi:hypothetical protein